MKLAIIPARGGSKRIKNKNIINFCGQPMISYPLNAIKKSGLFDKIHVSTDCETIASTVKKLGYEIDFMRDASLADDHTGLIPVVKWVYEKYKSLGQVYSEICLVLPTSPLLLSSDLTEAHKLFEFHKQKITVMSSGRFEVPTQWALKKSADGVLHPLWPDQLQVRSQDLEEHFYDAGSFYFMNSSRIDDFSKNGFIPYLIPKNRCIDIDEESDLILAESLYKILNSHRGES